MCSPATLTARCSSDGWSGSPEPRSDPVEGRTPDAVGRQRPRGRFHISTSAPEALSSVGGECEPAAMPGASAAPRRALSGTLLSGRAGTGQADPSDALQPVLGWQAPAADSGAGGVRGGGRADDPGAAV